MSELKDPAIKLFGKTISFPVSVSVRADHNPGRQSSSNTAVSEDIKNASGEDLPTENKHEDDDDSSKPAAEDSTEPANASGIDVDHKTSGFENEISSPKDGQQKEDPGDNLKKPDKILPCPRCNSMDTKFCYYNNYNVNQPRHFCKNCQRYWTAGGTIRNVPVGSGRRKNKNSCPSHYRHIMVSDALHTPRTDVPNGIHLHSLKANGTVLAFGSERPLCESMASVLNLAERSQNRVPNGFHEQETAIPSSGEKEIGKDHASVNSSTTSNSSEKGISAESVTRSSQAYIPQPPPFPGPPWPYPWNSAQWRTQFPPPTLGPSGFPITFYPAPAPPYWGCAPPYWGVAPPWLFPAPSCPDHSALSSSPTSATLGKHTREGEILSPSNQAKEETFEREDGGVRSILIPKTLRIDDPNEAAKSSIWSTLGIKNEKIDSGSINRTSLFKAFPSKGEFKNRVAENSLVLQANPAAFSRSQSFHEST